MGPRLLQTLVASRRFPEVGVLPASTFYPLPPEISEHWFRLSHRSTEAGKSIAAALSFSTRVVHWYASVRSNAWVPRIDPDWVREHADRQLLSALVLPSAEAPLPDSSSRAPGSSIGAPSSMT